MHTLDRRLFLKFMSMFLVNPPIVSAVEAFQGTPNKQSPNTAEIADVNRRDKLNFRLFDQLNFRNCPHHLLRKSGLRPLSVIYADQMWPDRVKKDFLNVEFLRYHFGQRPLLGDGTLLCLDIEHWPTRRVSEITFDRSVGLFQRALSVFRSLYPTAKIGLFEFSPMSFYPLYHQFAEQRIDKRLYEAWTIEMDRLRVITDYVDVFFPQLYSRWPENPIGWERCARTVMKEARRLAGNRPIIPFIWPQFWLKGTAPIIPGEYWKKILYTMYELADSVVIWSIYKNAPEWQEKFAWWRETKDFMEDIS